VQRGVRRDYAGGGKSLPSRLEFRCNTKSVNDALLAANAKRLRIAAIWIALCAWPCFDWPKRSERTLFSTSDSRDFPWRSTYIVRVSAWEGKIVKSLGMRYVHLEFHGEVIPTQEQIEKALSVLEDRTQAPVFVHCHEGKDRTGMIIACYRISHDRWSNVKALAEAKSWASRELTSAMERSILQYRPRSLPTHE
jgi:hypothetical protein